MADTIKTKQLNQDDHSLNGSEAPLGDSGLIGDKRRLPALVDNLRPLYDDYKGWRQLRRDLTAETQKGLASRLSMDEADLLNHLEALEVRAAEEGWIQPIKKANSFFTVESLARLEAHLAAENYTDECHTDIETSADAGSNAAQEKIPCGLSSGQSVGEVSTIANQALVEIPAGAEPESDEFAGLSQEDQLKRFFEYISIKPNQYFIFSASFMALDNDGSWRERWTHRLAQRCGKYGDATITDSVSYGKHTPTRKHQGPILFWCSRKENGDTKDWQYFIRTAHIKLNSFKVVENFNQITRRRAFFAECDTSSLVEQRQRIHQLEGEGLFFNAIVFSGSKSLHLYLTLPEDWSLTPEQDLWINQAICLLVRGDKQAQTANQASRLPGARRPGKHNQTLIGGRLETYSSYEELRELLERLLTAEGITDVKTAYAELRSSQGRTGNKRGIVAGAKSELRQEWETWDKEGGWSEGDRKIARALPINLSDKQFLDLLPKRARKLILEGSENGDRWDDGTMLTLSLRGAANVLADLGMNTESAVELILDQFCENSGGDVDRERLDYQYEGADDAHPGRSVASFMNSIYYLTDGRVGTKKKQAKDQRKEQHESTTSITTNGIEGNNFTILGWDGSERNGIAYRACRTGQIAVCACRNSTDLLRLAPLDYWVELFGQEVEDADEEPGGGEPPMRVEPPNWTQAISAVIEATDAAGVFDRELLRGHGVWRDQNSTVWHLGDYLEVDGVRKELHEFRGQHHYARLAPLRIDPTLEPLLDHEGAAVRDAIYRIGFEGPMDALHLSGWIVLANVCGALDKRPGVQLTGPTAGGKTTVAKDVIFPLTAELSLYSSNSSEAGVRQGLGCSSRAALIDESEQENERKREAQIRLVRLSYDGVQSLMGTPSGQQRSFALRASICLIGINSTISNAADRNRIVTITRVALPLEQWQPVEQMLAELITTETGARLIRRTVSNMDTLLHNIKTFGRVVTKRYGGRAGDTYGALLAGAHHLACLDQLDETEAELWVQNQGWGLEVERVAEATAANEAEKCLERLLKHKIAFKNSDFGIDPMPRKKSEDDDNPEIEGLITDGRGMVTVRELIQAVLRWQKQSHNYKDGALSEANTCLGRLGVKVNREKGLVVHTGHKGDMTDIYDGSRWSGGAFKDRFLDLPGAQKLPSNERFPVLGPQKALAIPLVVFLETEAPPTAAG